MVTLASVGKVQMHLEVSLEDIVNRTSIARGATAGVYKGVWNGKPVAVKMFYKVPNN